MPVDAIAFGASAIDTRSFDDARFLPLVVWRKSGDRKLTEAARTADVAAFSKALRRTISQRRSQAGTKRATGTTLPPLLQPLWSQHAWDDPTTTERLSEMLTDLQRRVSKSAKSGDRISRGASKRVAACLEAVPPDTSPWAQVVWLTVLVQAADLLDDQTLSAIWRQTLASVIPQAKVKPKLAAGDAVGFSDDRQLLLTGELPWLAGLVFADVKGAGNVRRAGRSELRKQLKASTDTDGTPHARSLHRLPLTLAVFTRSLSIGRACGERLFDNMSSDRFGQLVSRTVAMAQTDGRLALSNGASSATGSLLRMASSLSGLTPAMPSFGRLQTLIDDSPTIGSNHTGKGTRLPKVKRRRATREKSAKKKGESPSNHSDWAELTCMRNNWSAGGDSCVIAHHAASPQLSVTAFERLLIDGNWRLDVVIDGNPVELTDDWSCVCWFSDEDADYVELQQEIEAGVTVMRQVLLSRTDHWLLLADNAKLDPELFGEGSSLQMTAHLPIAGNVIPSDNRWTRDISLRCGKLKARAYPVALEQQRVQNTDGSLRIDDDELVLAQSSAGGGLTMPLIIDWSPDRQRDEAQWQPLTVAEDGQTLPKHVACGQRLRIGRHQWLFYHSHQPAEDETGRSVLGHHTPHETVIAEFTSLGEVEPIVIIEG